VLNRQSAAIATAQMHRANTARSRGSVNARRVGPSVPRSIAAGRVESPRRFRRLLAWRLFANFAIFCLLVLDLGREGRKGRRDLDDEGQGWGQKRYLTLTPFQWASRIMPAPT
jgi:hypothetical protein